MNKSPTDNVLQQPQAASPHGLLLVYWPERAGGHLQHGWGQTYIHRCDPHWCTWLPGETAFPLLCHYRVWEKVQWVPMQTPRCTRTQCERKAGIIAAKTCGWMCPYWQSYRTAAKGQSWFQVKFVLLCLRSVSAVTFGLKTDVETMSRAKFIWR